MIKHSEYTQNSSELFVQYYVQFANDSIKCAVISLCKRGERNWWDIPLNEWDNHHKFVLSNQSAKKNREIKDNYNYSGMSENSFVWSLSDTVCTMKAYAISIYGDKPCKN